MVVLAISEQDSGLFTTSHAMICRPAYVKIVHEIKGSVDLHLLTQLQMCGTSSTLVSHLAFSATAQVILLL
jgi:hypothetical protein